MFSQGKKPSDLGMEKKIKINSENKKEGKTSQPLSPLQASY